MIQKGKILIVDDEQGFCELLENILQKEGFDTVSTTNPIYVQQLLEKEDFDLAFLDLKMPEMDGLELLNYIKTFDENIVVIIITAYGTIEKAVEAMRKGAYDFITKPFQKNDLIRLVNKAWDKRKLLLEMSHLRAEIQERYSFQNIIGKSKPMQDLFDLISKAANSPCNVLIQGESGTGKELVAKAIHYNSSRKNKNFVCLNAATLQETLLESQLFGHVKGAFTGAYKDQKGLFEVANGGTLFLDEVADMSPQVQAKLLRAIQEQEIIPLGSNSPRKVDVRIIAASNKDLRQAIKEGSFREDLYYRLSVITIYIPPLRERREDIPLLAMHFLHRYANEANKKIEGFTPKAMELLCNYSWPGNVRELENVIQSAIFLETGPQITTKSLNYDGKLTKVSYSPQTLAPKENNDLLPYAEAKRKFEREYLLKALEKCGGNISLTARKTGIIRPNLYKKLKKLNIHIKRS